MAISKDQKAYIIMLNDKPKLVVRSIRSVVSPMMSKMRTAHLIETMGDTSRDSRENYHSNYHWHIEEVDYLFIEYKAYRGQHRVSKH